MRWVLGSCLLSAEGFGVIDRLCQSDSPLSEPMWNINSVRKEPGHSTVPLGRIPEGLWSTV
ncbi:rCG63105 [Rattus norvegicus]|uniref:RCG63105 n=1 Tax=Rattus norvegicus TaxID=10116 RepID=A6KKV6_RAT|nr:rCG63105 [Rattus norvegicus]